MSRGLLISVLCASLAGCGGLRDTDRGPATRISTTSASLPFATGPIQRACRVAGRKQASQSRCGCVQAVADVTLSSADQRRGVAFFDDPQKAQDVRQSDLRANELFWDRWVAFGTEARKVCT